MLQNAVRAIIAAAAAIGLTTLAFGQQSTLPVTDDDLARTGTPGLAYLVIDGDQREGNTFGVKKAGGTDPITLDTAFLIGSISKSFTALAAMQLVEAEKLDLDTPVSAYLNELEGTPAGQRTLRQLMSHTSGYSTAQGNTTQADLRMDAQALADRVKGVSALEPVAPVDRQWDYSNANYQIVGRVIEKVAAKPFDAVIEDSILAPLEMTNSRMHDGEVASGQATGHSPWFFGKRALTENKTGRGSAPQGGVITTPNDLAKYARMMMNGQDDLITAQSKALMMTGTNEVWEGYGFGWFIGDGGQTIYHSGANPGYEASLTLVPAENKAIIAMVNAGDGFAFGRSRLLLDKVWTHYLGTPERMGQESTTMKAVAVVLMVLPLIFLALIVRQLWSLRKPMPRPRNRALRIAKWLVPIILAAGWAYALVVMVPAQFGASFAAARTFQPDTALLLALNAALTVGWALVRAISAKVRPEPA